MRLLALLVFVAAAATWMNSSEYVAEGASRGLARSGGTSALADYNGDGFADVAIGVPREDVGTVEDAGAVNVLYGSESGLQASSPEDQFWTQNSFGVRDSAESFDSFGASLASGDFNADGFTDLAIGIPGEDVATIDDAGAINVLHGSSTGLQAGSPDDQFWTQNSPGVQDVAEKSDTFGSSLAVGDFNADGFTDLAVGVAHEDIGSVLDAGAANILYGSASGLQAGSPDDQFWNQDSPGVQDTAEAGDEFGGSLTVGDFNADGFSDLAVGAPFETAAGSSSPAGAVNVLYGSAGGLQSTAPDDQFWNQDSTGVRDSAESGDEFGFALSAGDFNGDGFADLAIGVPGETLGVVPQAGAVSVLYGSDSGLQASSPDDQIWSQGSNGVQDTRETSDQFGRSLSVGNFDGNAFADLAIGVPFEDIGTVADAGAVEVLYGTVGGVQATSPDDQFWSQDSSGVLDSAEQQDSFGFAVITSDWNRDDFSDLASGIPFEGVATPFGSEGATSVLYGSSAGLQADAPDDQFWNQDSPGVRDSAETSDNFGLTLA